jgi:hypothetical protein
VKSKAAVLDPIHRARRVLPGGDALGVDPDGAAGVRIGRRESTITFEPVGLEQGLHLPAYVHYMNFMCFLGVEREPSTGRGQSEGNR